MLYLMAAALSQTATAKPMRLADCKPVLSLASLRAGTNQPQRRDAPPKRPKPCMVLASA